MDATERQITKIARDVSKFTVQMMREDGVGTAEFDFIHFVRHNPGVTQSDLCEQLHMDKGAAARRAASLEAKGYLRRKTNPADGRSRLLYATEKAELLKNSKAHIEAAFYDWLTDTLDADEKAAFCATLDKLYRRAKAERLAGFEQVRAHIENEDAENES